MRSTELRKMDRNIFLKACSYCAYQERTQNEVRERLKKWQVWGNEAEEIIAELILENFINEERFAKVFAGSKFRVKKWGKKKILLELKRRNISDYCIKQGMKEIDQDNYEESLKELFEKKIKTIKRDDNPLITKQKLARYALGKGFESELVWRVLKEVNLD
ncbi:regulatory protein [Spirosomataceae bacterium TFI 002]|nr:regulatory protein [Spirosomataceae bacterium TFI 002]